MNKSNILIPAGCAVAGVVIGFVGGFIFAKRKYKKLYEEKYDKDIYDFKKGLSNIEGTPVDEKKAEEIVKDSPESAELWTESFKKQQEKMKAYKNIVREAEYDIPEDAFDNEKFEKENYERCKQYFEDQLNSYSEYSGISKDALLDCSVRVMSEEEYYEETHNSEPLELQWDPHGTILRDEDGEILEPEITFGNEWKEVLEYAEKRPDQITYVYDERIDNYYSLEIENPRSVK